MQKRDLEIFYIGYLEFILDWFQTEFKDWNRKQNLKLKWFFFFRLHSSFLWSLQWIKRTFSENKEKHLIRKNICLSSDWINQLLKIKIM